MKISYGFIIEIIDGVREWLLEIKDCLNFIANPDGFSSIFHSANLSYRSRNALRQFRCSFAENYSHSAGFNHRY